MEQMEQSFLESLESKTLMKKLNISFYRHWRNKYDGLAEILISLGHKVSGSDIRPSSITQKLEKRCNNLL